MERKGAGFARSLSRLIIISVAYKPEKGAGFARSLSRLIGEAAKPLPL